MLQEFNMTDCAPNKLPLAPGIRISKSDCPKAGSSEAEEMKAIPYRSVVGSLSWVAITCRPDIAYAVTSLAKVQANPAKTHWTAAKGVLRYLAGTKDFGITYRGGGSALLTHADADWAGDRDERRSTTGYCVSVAGGLISWCSKLQPTISLSSTEAEYMAVGEAARESIYLRRLYGEIAQSSQPPLPIQLRNDNKGAIEISKNPTNHNRTKHIDIRHHFIRERIKEKEITITYISTKEMIADLLTKPIGLDLFQRGCKGMGME